MTPPPDVQPIEGLSAETLLAGLTSVAAALVAVALALLAVLPSLLRQAQESSGHYTAEHFNRRFRAAFFCLLAAVACLVAAAGIGIAGLFWPSRTVADIVGVALGIGILTLAGGAAGFAIVTVRSLLGPP